MQVESGVPMSREKSEIGAADTLGLKPGLILGTLRGAEAPLFHFPPLTALLKPRPFQSSDLSACGADF